MEKVFTLLILAVFLISCSEGNNSQLIDQQSLESSQYKKFRQESQKEAARRKSRKGGLTAHLQKLGSCKEVKSVALPIKIDRKVVASLMKASDELCEQLKTSEELGFDVWLLREVSSKNYVLKWVLLKGESLYINWSLLAVIFRNGDLTDYKRVGVFQKNLSKDIDTQITVSKSGNNLVITSTINRKVIYPIEQESTVNSQFIINSKGIIQNSP